MNPEQKNKWISHVEGAILKRKDTITSLEHARNTAESPMTSRYDTQRDNFNNDVNINLGMLQEDEIFLQELEHSGECSEVQPGAVVTLSFRSFGDVETVLFMNNSSVLPDIQVVTTKSPVGEAINGKRLGDTVSYSVGDNSIEVDILEIE